MKKLIGITLLLTSALSAAPIYATMPNESEIDLFSLKTGLASFVGVFDQATTFLFASQIFPQYYAADYRDGIYPCQNSAPYACPFNADTYNASLGGGTGSGGNGGVPSAPEPSTWVIGAGAIALILTGVYKERHGRQWEHPEGEGFYAD